MLDRAGTSVARTKAPHRPEAGGRTLLSIVTPCFNEEGGILACYAAVRAVMTTRLSRYDYEHIFIDNCSTDRTLTLLRGIAAEDPRARVIVNARNFGPERSPFHAIREAGGDIVAPILADLQTPPELLPQMVELWEGGAKVVAAVKRQADSRLPWRLARGGFYRLMRAMSRVEQIDNFIGFGLYDRCVVDVLRQLNEPEPYFRGLVCEIGFERATVSYDQPPRRTGRSSYTLAKLVDYALIGLSSYSRAPLRLMTLTGFIVSAISFLIAIGYLVAKLLFWYSLPVGVAPVIIAVFFLGSVQLLALGVIGEYVGLLLNYTRRFPLVIEKERINFD